MREFTSQDLDALKQRSDVAQDWVKVPKIPREDTTSTLDDWLRADLIQTDVIIPALGCKHPEYHKEQKTRHIAVLKQFVNTFGEYMRIDGEAREQMRVGELAITNEMRDARKCHRNFGEKDSRFLLRCYCDEHAH